MINRELAGQTGQRLFEWEGTEFHVSINAGVTAKHLREVADLLEQEYQEEHPTPAQSLRKALGDGAWFWQEPGFDAYWFFDRPTIGDNVQLTAWREAHGVRLNGGELSRRSIERLKFEVWATWREQRRGNVH